MIQELFSLCLLSVDIPVEPLSQVLADPVEFFVMGDRIVCELLHVASGQAILSGKLYSGGKLEVKN